MNGSGKSNRAFDNAGPIDENTAMMQDEPAITQAKTSREPDVRIMAFDFQRREDREIQRSELALALAGGCYCWINICGEAGTQIQEIAAELKLGPVILDPFLSPGASARWLAGKEAIGFTLSEASWQDDRLNTQPIRVLLANQGLLTLQAQPSGLIRHILDTCQEDFQKYSQSPGFLLFELGDHLASGCQAALETASSLVALNSARLFKEADDALFETVTELMQDLLRLRKVLMEAREVFHALSIRKSPFISETTQPFLRTLAETLDRLGNDLGLERDMLAEALNLYMGMSSHRTGNLLKRLTLISMIFLPLTFLCGVYGMNFEHQPEFQFRYAYPLFWALVALITAALLLFMKRRKWM